MSSCYRFSCVCIISDYVPRSRANLSSVFCLIEIYFDYTSLTSHKLQAVWQFQRLIGAYEKGKPKASLSWPFVEGIHNWALDFLNLKQELCESFLWIDVSISHALCVYLLAVINYVVGMYISWLNSLHDTVVFHIHVTSYHHHMHNLPALYLCLNCFLYKIQYIYIVIIYNSWFLVTTREYMTFYTHIPYHVVNWYGWWMYVYYS